MEVSIVESGLYVSFFVYFLYFSESHDNASVYTLYFWCAHNATTTTTTTVTTAITIDPIRYCKHNLSICKSIVAILENAIQNTEADGEVFLHVALDTRLIRITVMDSGIGMTPEALEELLTRLQSGTISFHESGSMGLGISLTIAHHTIVNLLKGQIFFKSGLKEPSSGSSGSIDEQFVMPKYAFQRNNAMGFTVQIGIPLPDDSVVFFSSRMEKTKQRQGDKYQITRENNVQNKRPSVIFSRGNSHRKESETKSVDVMESNANEKSRETKSYARKKSIFVPPPTIHFDGNTINVPLRDHVLAVDDDPINLKILVKILQKEGMKVIQASCGQEASNLYQMNHKRLGIVFTDVQMRVSGIDMAKKIRAYEKTYSLQPAMETRLNEFKTR